MAACVDFPRQTGRLVFLTTFSLVELEVETSRADLFEVQPVDTEDTGIQEDMILATAATENTYPVITWGKLLVAIFAMAGIVGSAYVVLDGSISDARKEATAQTLASENRISETLKSIDSRLQGMQVALNTFQANSATNDHQIIKEIAELRIRQAQTESRQ